MSKAFTTGNRRRADEDDDDSRRAGLPAGGKNYITPAGYARLRGELMDLIDDERPKVVEVVPWAASNGDRSENGDYIYGKKRLREIDRRIRFLTKRLEIAEVVDPSRAPRQRPGVFRRHRDLCRPGTASERTVTILGIDEVDNPSGRDQLDLAGRARPAQGPCRRCGGAGHACRAWTRSRSWGCVTPRRS